MHDYGTICVQACVLDRYEPSHSKQLGCKPFSHSVMCNTFCCLFSLFCYGHCLRTSCARRPDRLAQAIPQWQARGSGYIGVMRVGSDAHDMPTSPWYDPLGVLYNKKYHMYASGGMYALSSEAVQLLTQVPLRQRRLSGGSDDVSVGLWVMAYNISYLDDRRLGVQYSNGSCPDDFIGEQLHAALCAKCGVEPIVSQCAWVCS